MDIEPRQSSRVTRPLDRYGFPHTSLTTTLDTIFVPHSYSQTFLQTCLQRAMQKELQALQDNHTWDIVSCPPSVKPIGCKWVYYVKY